MTADQLRVYEDIVAGPRDTLVGPLRAALLRPELADRWQKFGALLRYETSLPARLSELAILVTARRWNSQVEWHIHAEAARLAGLPGSVITAIQYGRSPQFHDRDEAGIYEFARQLQDSGEVSTKVYEQVLLRLDAIGIVELTAIIGYYTMVSMTLNAHEIPLPGEVLPPLQPVHRNGNGSNGSAKLTKLPPARLVKNGPVTRSAGSAGRGPRRARASTRRRVSSFASK